MALRSPIRWFGGKGNMTAKLLPLVPAHKQYVEPFFGGGSLFFAKSPAPHETINDIDENVVAFFRVLRDPTMGPELIRRTELTPYARAEWSECRDTWRDCEDPVERAFRWFVVARMSFSGLFGQSMSTTVIRARRGRPGAVNNYRMAVSRLPQVAERLLTTQIECADFRTVMERYCTPDSFCYCDPPYVHSSRRDGGYAHEMTDVDHCDLVEMLLRLPGRFMLSGYASGHDIYAPLEDAGWHRIDWETACHAAGRTRHTGIQGAGAAMRMQRRIESVWLDPQTAAERAPRQGRLELTGGDR